MACKDCGEEMNVAEGTFGYGIPKKCPVCGKHDLIKISDGWKMNDGTIYPEPYDPPRKTD
jgi:hypothetical protein